MSVKAAEPPVSTAELLLHTNSFRAYSLARALVKAKEFGYEGVELAACHYDAGRLEEEAERLSKLSEECQVPIRAVSFEVDLLAREEERWSHNVAALGRALQIFGQLGVKIVNCGAAPLRNPESAARSGSWLAQDWHYERVATGLRQVVPLLEKADLSLCLETRKHTLHDTALSTKRLLDCVASQRVKATLDPANLFATPGAEEPASAARILGDRVGYWHIANAKRVGEHYDFSVSVDEGNLDYFSIFQAAREFSLKLPMCVEYCGHGDPARAAARDPAYIRALLAEVRASP